MPVEVTRNEYLPDSILNDARAIKSIWWDDEDGSGFVARDGVVIQAYGEDGMHCYIPYIRIIDNGVVVHRIPAYKVRIVYDAEATL